MWLGHSQAIQHVGNERLLFLALCNCSGRKQTTVLQCLLIGGNFNRGHSNWFSYLFAGTAGIAALRSVERQWDSRWCDLDFHEGLRCPICTSIWSNPAKNNPLNMLQKHQAFSSSISEGTKKCHGWLLRYQSFADFTCLGCFRCSEWHSNQCALIACRGIQIAPKHAMVGLKLISKFVKDINLEKSQLDSWLGWWCTHCLQVVHMRV